MKKAPVLQLTLANWTRETTIRDMAEWIACTVKNAPEGAQFKVAINELGVGAGVFDLVKAAGVQVESIDCKNR